VAPPLREPVGPTLEIRDLSIAFSTPRGKLASSIA